MANVTYVVKKGDTLSGIAAKYNTTVDKLVQLNNIPNKNLIYVGQELIISGTASVPSTNNTYSPKITKFGLMPDSDRTMLVMWSFDKANVKHYEVTWWYSWGAGVALTKKSTTTEKWHTESFDDYVTNVSVEVRAISETHEVNGKDVNYFKGGTSSKTSDMPYYFDKSNPPIGTPNEPDVTIEDYRLTAEVNGLDDSVTKVKFRVLKDHALYKTSNAIPVSYGYASWSCDVIPGGFYQAQCKYINNNGETDWSELSGDGEKTIPSASSGISVCRAKSETSVYLEWNAVSNADSYDLEYATKKEYFDGSDQTTPISGIESTSYEKTGLEPGYEYFFRVRAVNDKGESSWSKIVSVILGTEPAAPTTWSSTTTVVTGEELTLYWVHNSEDNSLQRSAQVETITTNCRKPIFAQGFINATTGLETDATNRIRTNYISAGNIVSISMSEDFLISVYQYDQKFTFLRATDFAMTYNNSDTESNCEYFRFVVSKNDHSEITPKVDSGFVSYSDSNKEKVIESFTSITIINTEAEVEANDDITMHYSIDTSGHIEGVKIQWRVKTKGVANTGGPEDNGYSEWSIQRTVDVYGTPTLSMLLFNNNDEQIEELTAFPFYVRATAGPNTQTPTGYQLTVKSNSFYETTDSIGNYKAVSNGEVIYSQYFDTSASLDTELSANNIDLENNITYTVTCVVSMDSGLTAEESCELTVVWNDEYYAPNAEIGISEDDLTAIIRPYCTDENGNLLEDVSMAVYRREFDGSFTELARGLDNVSKTFITDPHPALDYARYRVVATTNSTGAVSYYDLPGYPIGETAVIIQWDEAWSNFEAVGGDVLAEPSWSGSMLKLPYNVDVSESNKSDVSLVEYIGRKHPVSYYGTQIGQTATWNVDIPKDDKETIYALRRLAIWMGDVYVREPSGTGYWANISVSFNQKHLDLTIPVSLNITRVAGGA